MVLLYDRAFVGGSFREAWRRRYGLYLALAGAWVLLVFMVAWSGTRGKSSGFGIEVGCWEYFCTQFGAILNYLKLCVWPRPLVFDYGKYIAENGLEIAVCGVVVVFLGLATVVALVRWPKVGFLGAWFFAILAPTTSIVPELQTVAEHRMYLPLAAVVTGLVVCGCLAGRRLVQRGRVSAFWSQVLGGCLVLSVIVVLAIFTFQRNNDYKSDMSIWQDTADQSADNYWADINLGDDLQNCGRIDEAIASFRKALEINPDLAASPCQPRHRLQRRGRIDEAIVHYRKALELEPNEAEANDNLGVALAGLRPDRRGDRPLSEGPGNQTRLCGGPLQPRRRFGRPAAGLTRQSAHYQKALEINPDYAEAHNNLGNVWKTRDAWTRPWPIFRRPWKSNPTMRRPMSTLANALQGRGQIDEAIAHFQKALEINPDFLEAHFNFAVVLAGNGKRDEAVEHFRRPSTWPQPGTTRPWPT